MLAFLFDEIGRPAHELHADQADHDDDDRDYHQHLDQRKAACRPACLAHLRPHCHDPMSASKPSPPDLRSAPKENTSTSPRIPGLRYWYSRPQGSTGSLSR